MTPGRKWLIVPWISTALKCSLFICQLNGWGSLNELEVAMQACGITGKSHFRNLEASTIPGLSVWAPQILQECLNWKRIFYILSNSFIRRSKRLPNWREKCSLLNVYKVEPSSFWPSHSLLHKKKKIVKTLHRNACLVVIWVTLALEAFWLQLVAAKPCPAVLSGTKIFHVVVFSRATICKLHVKM